MKLIVCQQRRYEVIDSAGSGEWALDLLYLLSVLGIWHIS